MGKYSNKPKKKKPVILKVILVILLVLILLVGAVVWFLWAKLDLIQFEDEIDNSVYYTESEKNATTEPEEEEGQLVDISGLEMVETAPPIPELEVFDEENVLNILLIGTDERTKEFNVSARSDSMILVSIDRAKNTVKLVSLERGVAAPVLEGKYEGQYDWLTHIFRYGGSELLAKTVEHMFKIDVDHYVRVNFNSVRQVVDAIGGIEIDLSQNEAWYLNLGLKDGEERLKSGLNHLNGARALSYARLREIDSDWQRVERQRKVILAVVDKLKGSSLTELNTLADTVLPLIQTNLSKLEIAELVLYAPNFLSAEFDQMTIPQPGTYGGVDIMGDKVGFAIDYEVNLPILHEFLYGTEETE
ncbi:MAG: LCP family protein [Oscillospiraceae bacterium]|nr:LCP family protein [Oscillospiraceae bacterium]